MLPIRTVNIRCTICGCDEIVQEQGGEGRIVCNGCNTILSAKHRRLANGQLVSSIDAMDVVQKSPRNLVSKDLPIFGAKIFYKALFGTPPKNEVIIGNQVFKKKMFSNGQVPGFDTEEFRYIAQNPAKQSTFAEKARAGHKIMWVFKKNTPIGPDGKQESGYLLRVEDGQIYDVREYPSKLIGTI